MVVWFFLDCLNEMYRHITVLEHIHCSWTYSIHYINPCLDSLDWTFFIFSGISRISYKGKSLDCFLLMFTNQLILYTALIIVGKKCLHLRSFWKKVRTWRCPDTTLICFCIVFIFYTSVFFIFKGREVPDHKYHTNILETHINR